ncbi:toll/interleukin-1 receptor domain-containing protein [Burkholderia sp. B21-005]|uniref:toll/interleukin-1 receptor domain-containing protein n=1 Tax=Burkholderia sp. B21-005 TaxID=2890406 RepID=UPI001E3F4319|nr:toll/interleukin-1 receptor domain-containing protein [Burkholderia sp. B21-005]UEP40331.1 toll/interleukin-1 receptor domain-containing protein [Burkholderia sp. B21-005]
MQSTPIAPKVFVSHASEDKQRFVIPFATALRERGIDAWVDRWEMLPGDSLVDKIFEEGLEEAAAVVIVLSKVSVTKPWVREELNTAVVARIQKGTKIIPVVLEECEVPGAIKSLLWESVKDVNDFGDCLARVVDAIFGHTTKPPIGSAPAYVQTAVAIPPVGDLTVSDSFVLQALYEFFVGQGRVYIQPNELLAAATDHGLDASILSDCMEILAQRGYIEVHKHIGPGPYLSRILPAGVSTMLGDTEGQLIRKVALCIVNDGVQEASAIAAATGETLALVDHAIFRLESLQHVKASRPTGGSRFVYKVNPSLRRALES